MTQSVRDDHHGQPPDPALARVQARFRVLMLIAGLTLGVGIFAVFGAILYRIVTMDASEPPAPPVADAAAATVTRSALGLAADARLVAAAVEGGRLYLTYAHAGGETVVALDAATLTVTGRLEIAAD